jgi:hypothetical protein
MKPDIKFVTTSKRDQLIVNSSPLKDKKLDPEIVRKAFGAKRVGSTAGLDLFGLREVMGRMLASTGGRPSIEGAGAQVKIPRIEEDWAKIEKITASLANNLRHKPTSTQTAAFILHMALDKLTAADIARVAKMESEEELL